jgi:hypothetical protein
MFYIGGYIMNIIKIFYASLIGSLALIMMGSLCANNNPTTEKFITVKIDDAVLELYPPDAQQQAQILHALYNILNYDADNYNHPTPEEEYYKEYSIALKSVGHYTVLLWWNTLNARTKYGKTIADLPRHTFSWYGGANTQLQRIKRVLGIAIDKGKGHLTYREFLDTLESLYSENDSDSNRLIKKMIKERNHLRSLA